MKILIAYASKHGSTKGIAESIGEKLKGVGVHANVAEVDAVTDLEGFDAFVVGSAAYMGRWMKKAKQFVLLNQAILSSRPLWLFSSGPVGSQKKDAKGRDLLELSKPVEFDEFKPLVNPLDCKVFFGALHSEQLTGVAGFAYRAARKIKAARDNMPEGDFRDWDEIEVWTKSIVEELAKQKE